MPLAGGVAEPQTVAMRHLARVKAVNNISDMALNKEVEQYEREKTINISAIDQERFDVMDFMKKVKKCDSEDLPEGKLWLGMKLPDGTRMKPEPRERPQLETPVPIKKEEERKPERTVEPDELERYNFRFKNRPQPEMVNRTCALHNIFMRRNLYQSAEQAWGLPTEGAGDDESRPKSVSFKSGSGHGRQKSANSLAIETVFEENFPSETASARGAPRSRLDFPRLVNSARSSYTAGDGDFMKQLLVRKYKKKKRPIKERLGEFYEKVDALKAEDEKARLEPASWEVRRKWTLMTKGIKAALDESSDEEEEDQRNTV